MIKYLLLLIIPVFLCGDCCSSLPTTQIYHEEGSSANMERIMQLSSTSFNSQWKRRRRIKQRNDRRRRRRRRMVEEHLTKVSPAVTNPTPVLKDALPPSPLTRLNGLSSSSSLSSENENTPTTNTMIQYFPFAPNQYYHYLYSPIAAPSLSSLSSSPISPQQPSTVEALLPTVDQSESAPPSMGMTQSISHSPSKTNKFIITTNFPIPAPMHTYSATFTPSKNEKLTEEETTRTGSLPEKLSETPSSPSDIEPSSVEAANTIATMTPSPSHQHDMPVITKSQTTAIPTTIPTDYNTFFMTEQPSTHPPSSSPKTTSPFAEITESPTEYEDALALLFTDSPTATHSNPPSTLSSLPSSSLLTESPTVPITESPTEFEDALALLYSATNSPSIRPPHDTESPTDYGDALVSSYTTTNSPSLFITVSPTDYEEILNLPHSTGSPPPSITVETLSPTKLTPSETAMPSLSDEVKTASSPPSALSPKTESPTEYEDALALLYLTKSPTSASGTGSPTNYEDVVAMELPTELPSEKRPETVSPTNYVDESVIFYTTVSPSLHSSETESPSEYKDSPVLYSSSSPSITPETESPTEWEDAIFLQSRIQSMVPSVSPTDWTGTNTPTIIENTPTSSPTERKVTESPTSWEDAYFLRETQTTATDIPTSERETNIPFIIVASGGSTVSLGPSTQIQHHQQPGAMTSDPSTPYDITSTSNTDDTTESRTAVGMFSLIPTVDSGGDVDSSGGPSQLNPLPSPFVPGPEETDSPSLLGVSFHLSTISPFPSIDLGRDNRSDLLSHFPSTAMSQYPSVAANNTDNQTNPIPVNISGIEELENVPTVDPTRSPPSSEPSILTSYPTTSSHEPTIREPATISPVVLSQVSLSPTQTARPAPVTPLTQTPISPNPSPTFSPTRSKIPIQHQTLNPTTLHLTAAPDDYGHTSLVEVVPVIPKGTPPKFTEEVDEYVTSDELRLPTAAPATQFNSNSPFNTASPLKLGSKYTITHSPIPVPSWYIPPPTRVPTHPPPTTPFPTTLPPTSSISVSPTTPWITPSPTSSVPTGPRTPGPVWPRGVRRPRKQYLSRLDDALVGRPKGGKLRNSKR